MRYIAFDKIEDQTPICGPEVEVPWSRLVIAELLRNNPDLKGVLKPTDELLSSGEKFAYIISWRYYFGYHDEMEAPTRIRRSLQWIALNKPLHNAFKSGQGILVFADWYEGVFIPPALICNNNDKFACFFNTFRIPPKHVFFVDGNARAARYEHIYTPRFVYANIFESSSLYSYTRPDVLPTPTKLIHPAKKPLRYLSYARHWNTMRQYFTFDLFDRDLLKHGLVSCSGESAGYPGFLHHIDRWTPGVSNERIRAFLQTLPLTLDADLSMNQAHSVNVKHHLDTDISVIHETHSNVESVFLSEKTYRALFLKHPFLMMGSPGLLAQLRADGYQTYGCLFDESYDEEKSLRKRKEMVLGELTKFIQLEDDTREAKLLEAQDVASKNQEHFLTQLDRPRFGHNLIEALKD
jgi:hypothetical protein